MPISILPVIPSPPKTFQDEAKNKAVHHTSSIFIGYGSLKPVHDGKTSTGSTAKWPVLVSAQESNLWSNRDNFRNQNSQTLFISAFIYLFTDSCVLHKRSSWGSAKVWCYSFRLFPGLGFAKPETDKSTLATERPEDSSLKAGLVFWEFQDSHQVD